MADGSPWTAWALNAVYTGGTLCAGALLLLYVFQEKLLYYPTIPGAPKLTKENPRGTTGRRSLPSFGWSAADEARCCQATATQASTASTTRTW
jgi:hypothetical protein